MKVTEVGKGKDSSEMSENGEITIRGEYGRGVDIVSDTGKEHHHPGTRRVESSGQEDKYTINILVHPETSTKVDKTVGD